MCVYVAAARRARPRRARRTEEKAASPSYYYTARLRPEGDGHPPPPRAGHLQMHAVLIMSPSRPATTPCMHMPAPMAMDVACRLLVVATALALLSGAGAAPPAAVAAAKAAASASKPATGAAAKPVPAAATKPVASSAPPPAAAQPVTAAATKPVASSAPPPAAAQPVTAASTKPVASAAPPPATAGLVQGFYRASCPDAEKVIFTVIEKRFKEDPGTAAGLLRLLFHDCFANGCDASILIDPLSNQSSEKEAGPNVTVRGYEIIDEIKAELEKRCPNVVSCADILAVGTRDAVRLAGGPAYEVPTGRRDSLESNREDADNLPGPDIPVPKVMSNFAAQGFTAEEMIVLVAGGHSIGSVHCLFIETDAAPIDPAFKTNITAICDRDERSTIPMDPITPNVMDTNYFGLVLAKKMPLTIDRLLGLDPRTLPIIKSMIARPGDLLPLFGKAMEKLSVLKVLTGKNGEIRKECSEFNNPTPNDGGPSVIRVSSLLPGETDGLSAGEAAKVKGGKVPGGAPNKVDDDIASKFGIAIGDKVGKKARSSVKNNKDRRRPKLRGSARH